MSDLNDTPCSLKSLLSVDENITNISMPPLLSDNSNLTEDASFISTPDSKVNDCSHLMNWSVSSVNEFRYKEFAKPDIHSTSLGNQIQLFRRLSQDVNHSRIRFNRTQFLINVMNDLFTSDTSELPVDLREKCLEGLQNFQLHNFLKNNPELGNSIDVEIPEKKIDFTVHEGDLLRSVIKNHVSVKCAQLKEENDLILSILNYQRNRVPLPGSVLNEEEAVTLHRVSDTASLIEKCAENIRSVINLNDELYDVRATKFRELQKAEMESLESKTKLISLQIKNLNYMIENAFMQQFDKMAEAVNVVYKELQMSLHEAEYMLQKTKLLKHKYDLVRGNKFDEILNEYTQLRDNYKHKTWALKQITSSNS